jgi:hypothetical protein
VACHLGLLLLLSHVHASHALDAAGRGVAGGSRGPGVCHQPGAPPSWANTRGGRGSIACCCTPPGALPNSTFTHFTALFFNSTPALLCAPQVSGDPKGFDLTGDGERWEAAGGDEISEAAEFPTVLYDKWVEVLGQAAEGLEWEPAQGGGGAGPGGSGPGVGAGTGGGGAGGAPGYGWRPCLHALTCRAPCLFIARHAPWPAWPWPWFRVPPWRLHAHTSHCLQPLVPQWEALWKNLQKWGRLLSRAGLDFGTDTGMAELQDISEEPPPNPPACLPPRPLPCLLTAAAR